MYLTFNKQMYVPLWQKELDLVLLSEDMILFFNGMWVNKLFSI